MLSRQDESRVSTNQIAELAHGVVIGRADIKTTDLHATVPGEASNLESSHGISSVRVSSITGHDAGWTSVTDQEHVKAG